MDDPPSGQPGLPSVVVVGACGSGKTTLVDGLRELGVRAMVCGQEHSEIRSLWRRTNPDFIVALEVDLLTLRRRRGSDWPEWLYRIQRRRLEDAMAAADILLDTSVLDADAVLGRVAMVLGLGPGSWPGGARCDRSVG